MKDQFIGFDDFVSQHLAIWQSIDNFSHLHIFNKTLFNMFI